MQRDRLKFPTMQCSHHQKPSISSALWRDVPAHEQNRGREKWRKWGEAQPSPQECCWVLNKWKTPLGIQTNQSLSLQDIFFSLSACWKDCSKPSKGLWDRDAAASCNEIRGWLARPSESAVSCFQALGRAAQVRHHNVSALSTQGQAATAPGARHSAARPGTQLGQAPRGTPGGKRACW